MSDRGPAQAVNVWRHAASLVRGGAMRELRQAMRALGRIPGATAVSIVTLGLGIAAQAATFAAVYAALLRPIPFDQPDRLVYLHTTRESPGTEDVRARWSYPLAATVRGHAASFASLATYSRTIVGVSGAPDGGRADPEQLDAEIVAAGFSEPLRVSPVRCPSV